MFDESEVIRVKPIVEHHRAEVDIIWCVRGPMDDHRTKDAPRVLSTIMGVVPGGAVEISIEAVGKRLARGDGALLYCRNAIEPRSGFLQDTMPVD